MNRRVGLGILIVAASAGGLALRLPRLNDRPMHGDEAVHALRLRDFWQSGRYVYDPSEYHGPTLCYLTAAAMWLGGTDEFADADETTFRVVSVAFGAALVLLAWPLAAGVGRPAAVAAAALCAVSPAMVFYSRYYIHEMLLVFFTFAAVLAFWRYARTGRLFWALLGGASAGLMHATKETWVIAAAAAAVALPAAGAWGRWVVHAAPRPRTRVKAWHLAAAAAVALPAAGAWGRWVVHAAPRPRTRVKAWHLAAAGVVGAALACVLLSGFGAHWRGAADSVRAYATYLFRASEEGRHLHPWPYYLRLLAFTRHGHRLIWSEGLILALAALGTFAALTRRGGGKADAALLRFLAFFTAAMTLAYSAIPYKTPWCALSFLYGMILLAGVGAAAVVRWLPRLPWPVRLAALYAMTVALGFLVLPYKTDFLGPGAIRAIVLTGGAALAGVLALRRLPARAACATLMLALAAQLAFQARRASLDPRFHASNRNPYVYAHPGTDLLNLVERIEDIAAVHPARRDMPVKIIAPGHDYWPLPWYLRRFNPDRVGYYDAVPPEPDAAVVVVSPELRGALEAHLRGRYQEHPQHFGLRPHVLLLAYVRADLWAAFMATRTRPSGQEAARP